MAKQSDFITLKEASQMSGYAPDYIGQLIRRGKLPGRQIYSNVQWVTTEAALRDYMAQGKEGKNGYGASTGIPANGSSDKPIHALRRLKLKLMAELQLAMLFKTVLWAAIGISIGFVLLLFYVFSVSFDRSIEQRALDEMPFVPLPENETPRSEGESIIL